MIVVTGGAGFIGSNLVYSLNKKGLKDILIVEELDTYTKKFNNLKSLDYLDCIDKDSFLKLAATYEYPAPLDIKISAFEESFSNCLYLSGFFK